MSQLLRAVLVGQHPSGKNQIGISALAAGKIHRYPQASFERWRATAYAQLDRYFRFYNEDRPHSALGGATPAEIQRLEVRIAINA